MILDYMDRWEASVATLAGWVRKALRDAHRWLDELLVDPTQTIESLAIRESKSERSIRMTLSLAFMSPALAEAAMEGRLPRGFCIRS